MNTEKKADRVLDPFGQIVLILYLLASLVLIFFHEPWEDELQAWCIAQELSIPEIFHQMRYEGHFALWYLLLKPFSFAGMPVTMLNLLSWLLCAAAAGIFLSGRGFGKTAKVLILFSCPLLYWFTAVARNYALIPPALALLACCYPVRLKKPFCYTLSLLLLVHSHAYMEGLAGILGVLCAWDLLVRCRRMPGAVKWKSAGVLLLLGAGVLAAFLQVAPAFGASSFAPASAASLLNNAAAIPGRVWNVLIRLSVDFSGRFANWTGPDIAALLFYLMLQAALFQLFRTRGARAVIIFLFGFSWQILFGALIYPIALHRIYLPLLMLVFCFALPVRKSRLRNIRDPRIVKMLTSFVPVGVLCLMTFPDLLYYASQDISLPFSDQQRTAFFIREQIPPEGKIYVFPATLITGTFRAYLPERVFYRCSDGRPFRLFRKEQPLPEQLDDALLKKLIGDDKEIYLLFQLGAFLNYRLPPGEEYDFPSFRMKLLYASYPLAFFSAGEVYAVFKVTRKDL